MADIYDSESHMRM